MLSPPPLQNIVKTERTRVGQVWFVCKVSFLVCKVCTHSTWYELVCTVLKCRFINMGILRMNCMGMQSMRYSPPPHTHT